MGVLGTTQGKVNERVLHGRQPRCLAEEAALPLLGWGKLADSYCPRGEKGITCRYVPQGCRWYDTFVKQSFFCWSLLSSLVAGRGDGLVCCNLSMGSSRAEWWGCGPDGPRPSHVRHLPTILRLIKLYFSHCRVIGTLKFPWTDQRIWWDDTYGAFSTMPGT